MGEGRERGVKHRAKPGEVAPVTVNQSMYGEFGERGGGEGGRGRERERERGWGERERERLRQTDRQTETEADGQRDLSLKYSSCPLGNT